MTTATFDRPLPGVSLRPSFATGPLGGALAAIVLCALYLASAYPWRQGALFLVGVSAGIVLYHAAFGFSSSWRALLAEGRGEGLRAQMLMLAVTCAVFLPILARGEVFGLAVRGTIAPFGLSVLVGAFMFGIGMQLGGGCASGTLYSAGAGSVRMVVTLVSFIAGSVLGAMHMPIWENAPSLGSPSLLASLGAPGALAVSLALFATVVGLTLVVEKRRGAAPATPRAAAPGVGRWLRGPWPLVAGALGLAGVNAATLLLAGRPWGVTSAFALWGSKALEAMSVDVAAWPYWRTTARAAELKASVFNDVTSVMDFGILLGALAAAGLAGRFAPTWRIPLRSLLAAVLGGLMLGYGARIAYGCNIGAFFSGIASTSLHGWLWFGSALGGNAVGTRLRPMFGLRV